MRLMFKKPYFMIFGLLALGLNSACSPAGWEKTPFPSEIEFKKVIASCQSTSFSREGIVIAYLELEPELAEQISQKGLDFFRFLDSTRDGRGLRPWATTPVRKPDGMNGVDEEGNKVYARILNDCGSSISLAPETRRTLTSAYKSGNGYYTTFNGGEGLLVVAPGEKLAGFFYFG